MPAYVTLPGTSGNYFSTPDVNLLDANSAHFQQDLSEGAGPYGMWGRSAASSLGPSTDLTPVFGDQHIHATLLTNAFAGFSNVSSRVACSPSTQYTFSLAVGRDTAADVNLQVLDYNAGGSAISTLINTTETVSVGAWTRMSGTFTTSGTAASLRMEVKATNATAGEELYMDAACLVEGTSSEFTPSLRIIGDVEIEAKIALDDYTPTATNTILDCLNSNDGYRLRHTTGDLIEIAYGNGSSTRAQTSSATGLTDGTAHVIKVTVDQSTGAVVYYIDGVQHDTDTMTTGAGSTGINDLVIGANAAASANWTDGDIYYVIVRDGIAGPVVARFDADDWVGV